MIVLEVNGATTVSLDFTDGMTVDDVQREFQDHQAGKHFRLNSFELYDPSQNRKLSSDDEIVDERTYVATVWVQTIVDDQGNTITAEWV